MMGSDGEALQGFKECWGGDGEMSFLYRTRQKKHSTLPNISARLALTPWHTHPPTCHPNITGSLDSPQHTRTCQCPWARAWVKSTKELF